MKTRLLISIIIIGVISLSGFLVYALVTQYQNLEHHKSQIAPRDELLLNLKDNSISDAQKRELVEKYNDLVNPKKLYLDYEILGLKNNYNLEDDVSFSLLEFGRYNSCWNLNVKIAETQKGVVIYDDIITQYCLEPITGINVNYKTYKIETACRINGTFDVHVSNIPAFEDTKIGRFTCGDGVVDSDSKMENKN
ncbi:MAG: hypothetical protein JHC41_07345 [Nitrosopumilus sp.]|jgi:hypothetical protein|nr:hypothetical protein [Nitrosopumilus sp.]